MSFVTIPGRVPVETIQALTNAALRVYLERHGWLCVDVWQHPRGGEVKAYKSGGSFIPVVDHDRFVDRTQRMTEAIGFVVVERGLRSADVIAELQSIAEWQRRCAEWVEPADTCSHCWACECELADAWETPGGLNPPFVASCPTCGNKRCPRATDHHNACSGSNEPGQEGSRYT